MLDVEDHPMSWLQTSRDKVKEATRADPIDCPRGWGPVSFQASINWFAGFFGVERACPISGSENCASCRHPYNPADMERLRERLEELQSLLNEGALTQEEHDLRRHLIVAMLSDPDAGSLEDGFRITAWILGPVGVVISLFGTWLAMTVHPGFWGLGGAGALIVALCLSFAALSVRRSTDPGPHDADWE